MCDYSLHCVPHRLAVEGEPLLVHRFSTGSLGLVSPADLRPSQKPEAHPWTGWWERIKGWLSLKEAYSVPAVCVPPGACLVLRDIPWHLQQNLGVGEEEEVIFIQRSAEAYSYRDAVRFRNGREVLLQKLAVGQRVDVLCLAPVEGKSRQLPSATSH